VVVAADLGIALGAVVAARHPEVSRGRTLVIDAGGLVGGLVGGGTAVLIDEEIGDRGMATALSLGAAAGLGLAAYLSRHWDD
jgi:hypothetical protein